MTSVKRSSNKSQETRKLKKILDEEVRLGIHARSDSESEEVDLKKELFPLGHYINDREEMIEQMFSIIKGEKLMKMLPPILKDIPLDEIKADCLIHLLGMSSKRIMATLEGRVIDSSSDSETNSGSSPSNKKPKLELKPFVIKQEGCSDISDNSDDLVLVEPDAYSSRSAKGSQKHKKRHKHKKNIVLNETRKKIHPEKVKKLYLTNHFHDSSTGSENEVEEDSPKEEKSLLEMLELEMRRRVIQALLDKEGKDNDLENKTQSSRNDSHNTKTKCRRHHKNQKVTPVKNFRRKKQKYDDVIIIDPELVTIDLTDENNKAKVDSTKDVIEQNNMEVINLINSIQIEADEEKTQLNVNNHTEECSNVSETKSDGGDRGSKTGHTVIDEVIDIPDSPKQSATHDNTEKQQLNPEEANGRKEAQPNSNWALRWLDSKDVKKVVSTSKICGNIRKKIKSAKLAKKSQENVLKGVETSEIHGSVVEYQLLPKSNMTLATGNTPTNTTSGSSTEDNKSSLEENQVIVELKQTALVVEQVQDVSSTRNEISVMTSTEDQVNETLNSNSNHLHDETDNDSQEIINIVSRPIQAEMLESNIIDTTSSKSNLLDNDTAPNLTGFGILNNNQEGNTYVRNQNDVSTSSSTLSSFVDNNLESEQVESNQTESDTTLITNSCNLKELENSSKTKPSEHCEPPNNKLDNFRSDDNMVNEPSLNLGINNETLNLDLNTETSKAEIILNQNSSICNSKNSSSDELTQKSTSVELSCAVQEIGNEPEALEIDITEEDREIE